MNEKEKFINGAGSYQQNIPSWKTINIFSKFFLKSGLLSRHSSKREELFCLKQWIVYWKNKISDSSSAAEKMRFVHNGNKLMIEIYQRHWLPIKNVSSEEIKQPKNYVWNKQ